MLVNIQLLETSGLLMLHSRYDPMPRPIADERQWLFSELQTSPEYTTAGVVSRSRFVDQEPLTIIVDLNQVQEILLWWQMDLISQMDWLVVSRPSISADDSGIFT